MKSLNKIVLGTSESIVNIKMDGKQTGYTGDSDQELKTGLPLTDFEISMNQLQELENEYDLTKMLDQLENNYKEEREEIYQSGFESGVEAGRKQYYHELKKEIDQFRSILTELEEQRWALDKEAEISLVDLVLQIVRRVIGNELKTDESRIEGVLREALGHIKQEELLKVIIHPDDFAFLDANSSVLDELPESVTIKTIPGIERGGCKIITNAETLDATIGTKLDQIAEQLYLSLSGEEE